jgi:osmotically-inducible protein OsmY
MFFFISVGLCSCIPAVIAGTAGVTYYIAKDERSTGTIIDDATITTEIKAKFLKDDLVSTVDIHVDTARGWVTLSGNVPSYRASIRALDIAKETNGVRRYSSGEAGLLS